MCNNVVLPGSVAYEFVQVLNFLTVSVLSACHQGRSEACGCSEQKNNLAHLKTDLLAKTVELACSNCQ